MKVLVVTPTTGAPELVDALISVRAQTFAELIGVELLHVVVVDGEEHQFETMNAITVAHASKEPDFYLDTRMVVWPFNTGGQGFYGHKIYAAVSQLVTPDIDWVLFLDQDNWYEPNHVESLVVKGVQEGLDYSYCLRKFYTWYGKYFSDDNCASLGKYKIWDNGGHYLIDTGCYCFRGSYISRWGHLWNMRWGADINFVETTMGTAKFSGTGLRTFCYRLGRPDAAKYEEEMNFITESNKYSAAKYQGNYPWER